MNKHRIASIDIGSNSIKLAIIEATASNSFTIVYREKDPVRLGHETLRNKHLSLEAIELAANSIGRFRAIAETRNADKIIAVATASVRDADNSPEFVQTVKEKTGVAVEILSAIEEARLIGIAAANFYNDTYKSLLNVDIGGGSTELSLMINGVPDKLFSVKLGAVGLTERFIKNDPPTKKELGDLRRFIRLALERPVRELNGAKWKIATGTSGTILALGGALNFENLIDGKSSANTQDVVIPFRRLAGFNEMVSKLKFEERLRLPGLSAQRAEIIIAGGQILEGVMQALALKELRPCELALREGAVIDYLRELEAEEKPPVPDVTDSRLRGVFAAGRRFSYEETHALQVAGLAEKIFDALMPIFNLKRHDRTLLSAAAILHDIGYHIAHAEHHKHSLYLIKHSELTGFSEPARNVIANVARYHRGSLPREKHAEFMALSVDDKQLVWRLGAILRLADALDRSYESNVADVRCQRSGKNIDIEIYSEKDCENELEAALQKADMFEVAFNCKLRIISRRFAVKA